MTLKPHQKQLTYLFRARSFIAKHGVLLVSNSKVGLESLPFYQPFTIPVLCSYYPSTTFYYPSTTFYYPSTTFYYPSTTFYYPSTTFYYPSTTFILPNTMLILSQYNVYTILVPRLYYTSTTVPRLYYPSTMLILPQ